MIKSLKDLLDKFSRFTNSLVYDGGICKRLYNMLIKNLLPVTLGNIIGGLFFVGIVGFVSYKN